MADLSLIPNVTAFIEDNINQCKEMVKSEIAKEKIYEKCDYSEDDLAKLKELLTSWLSWAASWTCDLHLFQEGCQDLVEQRVYDALYSTLLP